MHSLFFLLWQRCQQTATCLHIQQKQSNIGICLKLCIWTPDECKSNIYPSFSYGSFSTMEKLKLLNASLCSLASCLLSLSAIWCLQKTAACCGWKICYVWTKISGLSPKQCTQGDSMELRGTVEPDDRINYLNFIFHIILFHLLLSCTFFFGYCCCS